MTLKQKNKQAIIEAASELFCEFGVTATSMDKVALVANVAKQTVYSHFSSKANLFIAAVEDYCQTQLPLEQILNDANSPERCLRHFGRSFTELICSERAVNVYRACVAEAISHPEVAATFYQSGPLQVKNALENYLRAVAEHGHFDFKNISFASTFLVTALQSEAKLKLDLNMECKSSLVELASYSDYIVEAFLSVHKI